MKRFLTNWWFVSALIAVLVALLLCWGLPIFVGFLRPWWVRVLAFVLIAGVWGLLAFLRIRSARKRADAIAAELAQAPPDGEARQLGERMAEALKTLRTAAGGKRRDYLYSRPWYVIIGPPGAGKTTALVNSGLRFPYSNEALRGVGGTRNLDFLFADEAVLVDTAGRYTSQDSDAAADAKGWDSFLALLRRNRPLQPVNGIIVAIGIDELIRGDLRAIDQHATTVRRRLAEISAKLEIGAPVYVLLTKADLLAGFIEYHEDLDVEGRRAVLGHTLPYASARPSADALAGAFDAMAQAIEARQAKRLAEEPDAPRRALLLGFPAQISQLRGRLLRFLDGVFVAGGAETGTLRGFYLTSGMQEGAPLDRMLSGMAEIYDQPRDAAGGSGRAYFLNRLLGVMFAEAGLVQLAPAARRRQRTQLTGAIATILGVSLLTLLVWGISFVGNRGFQSDSLRSARTASDLVARSGIDLVEVREDDARLDDSRLLDLLRLVRNLPRGYEQSRQGVPLAMGFGLYQSGLALGSEEAYRETLRRVLLPRILLQLEQNLRGNLANPLDAYEPLKIYLMLGGQCPKSACPDGIDRAAVKSWVTRHWSERAFPGPDSAQIRKELTQHLDVLLADPERSVSWQGGRAPLDGRLVETARAAVQKLSLGERAYAVLKQKAANAGGAPWSGTEVMASGDVAAFANGEALRQALVPFFFTRKGYETIYQPGRQTVQQDLERDLWMFSTDAQTASIRGQLGNVRGEVAAAYARDYAAAWDRVIAMAQPVDYFHNLPALAALGRASSPLKMLLLAVRENTSFAGGSRAAVDLAKQRVTARLGSASQLAIPTASFDAGQEIERIFKPLHVYVGDGKANAPIDELLTALRNAATAMQAANDAGGMGGEALQSQMRSAIAAVDLAAAGAPGQLKPFMTGLSSFARQGGSATASAAWAQSYASDILPKCREVTLGRYPFFSDAKAVDLTIAEANRVFGPRMLIDEFVRQVTPILVTDGPVWRWKDGDPVAALLNPASPDDFERAGQIRDLLNGGLTLGIRATSFGGGADGAQLKVGSSVIDFAPGDTAEKQLHWVPNQGGEPIASVTLMRGGAPAGAIAERGVWGLFRLVDRGRPGNDGEQAITRTYAAEGGSVSFRLTFPGTDNPFGYGGMWSFRCPLRL